MGQKNRSAAKLCRYSASKKEGASNRANGASFTATLINTNTSRCWSSMAKVAFRWQLGCDRAGSNRHEVPSWKLSRPIFSFSGPWLHALQTEGMRQPARRPGVSQVPMAKGARLTDREMRESRRSPVGGASPKRHCPRRFREAQQAGGDVVESLWD